MKDNTATAFTINTAWKTWLIAIQTSNWSEKVSISSGLDVTWNLNAVWWLELQGDITSTATQIDWDLLDNVASALSFDSAWKAWILNIITTDAWEWVTMSWTLGVTWAITWNLTWNASWSSWSCTWNSATATALETPRTIWGTSFDGTANITVASATWWFAVSGWALSLAWDLTFAAWAVRTISIATDNSDWDVLLISSWSWWTWDVPWWDLSMSAWAAWSWWAGNDWWAVFIAGWADWWVGSWWNVNIDGWAWNVNWDINLWTISTNAVMVWANIILKDTFTLWTWTTLADYYSLTAYDSWEGAQVPFITLTEWADATCLLWAYDTDWNSFTTFITLTAANTPTCDLAAWVTIWTNAILDVTSTTSALTTVWALNSWSITSWFWAIDIWTSNAVSCWSVELWHASDTTIARVWSGVISVEWVTIPTVSSTSTLTNKRITARVSTEASSATPTSNTDNVDMHSITAQAVDITSMTTNLSGTPTNWQKMIYRIKDDGTGRAITWGASFQDAGVALPATTVANKLLTVGFHYDTVVSKWWCVASVSET